jgi:hypothetical protein
MLRESTQSHPLAYDVVVAVTSLRMSIPKGATDDENIQTLIQ